MTFRIVSYNIRGGLGMDGLRSLDRIAAVVRELDPDIVCYQEVHCRFLWGAWENQPRKLALLTGLRTEFLATIGFPGSGYGIAIATRLAVTGRRHWLLSSMRERRGCLELALECEGRPLRVFCAHLGLESDERVRHAETIADVVREGSGAVVTAGDFNESVDGQAVRTLLSRTGLRDAAASRPEPTYPSDTPCSRIDFLLHSEDLIISDAFVVNSDASDHRPLVADFDFA
jgi:endonuclease/exonuclease/phosphatase family metal-dependent hydrolase